MKDLLARAGFDLPKIGQTITGEIISVSKNAVMVDLGSLGTGIVYPGEFYDRQDMQKALKPGQQVSAILLDIENEDGYRELSLKRAQMTTAWEDIRGKKESGEIVTTKIVNINKGGLIVEIDGIQGFLPLSQLAPEHYPNVEGGDTTKIVQALQKLRNQDMKIKILDFSEDENRLIVSEKAINEEQLKEELAKFKIGDVVEAEITGVTDFGAFAAIAAPSSQLPASSKEIIEETASSDQLPATSEETERQESESKQPELLQADVNQPEAISQKLEATKVEGLIHISEIDWKLVENPRDYLQTGQKVKTKIIAIDGSKVSLSFKALKPNPWEKIEEKYQVGQTLDGEIIKISDYGAIIKLGEEVSGFLPASEFGDGKTPNTLKVGDKLKVAIVSMDIKEHKIMLTLQKNEETKN